MNASEARSIAGIVDPDGRVGSARIIRWIRSSDSISKPSWRSEVSGLRQPFAAEHLCHSSFK
jgi:hypothetical protein